LADVVSCDGITEMSISQLSRTY